MIFADADRLFSTKSVFRNKRKFKDFLRIRLRRQDHFLIPELAPFTESGSAAKTVCGSCDVTLLLCLRELRKRFNELLLPSPRQHRSQMLTTLVCSAPGISATLETELDTDQCLCL